MTKGNSITTAEGVLLQGCGSSLSYSTAARMRGLIKVCPSTSALHTYRKLRSRDPRKQRPGFNVQASLAAHRVCSMRHQAECVCFNTTRRESALHGALLPSLSARGGCFFFLRLFPFFRRRHSESPFSILPYSLYLLL